MKKISISCLLAIFLSSCASPRLYYWGSHPSMDGGTSRYEQLAYANYDKQSPESLCQLVCLYEDMVQNPGGIRGVVPPGIYAEYGYLLLLPSTATAFEQHATERQRKVFSTSNYSDLFSRKGIEMLHKEIETYPESAKFINPLIKRLTD